MVDEEAGLRVFDITDPASPQIIAGVGAEGLGCANAVTFVAPFIYLATSEDLGGDLYIAWQQCDGIVAIEDDIVETNPDEQIPSAGLNLALHPNPFNPQTTITFSLGKTHQAEIAVYDLTGKLLGVLADRSYSAGDHSVVWNGKDATGRSVPSGTYIVCLETESGVEARKVMLVR